MSQREHGMLLSAGRMWRRQWRVVLWHCSRFWRLLQCHREACLRSSQVAQLVVGYISLKVGYIEQIGPVLVWASCLYIFFLDFLQKHWQQEIGRMPESKDFSMISLTILDQTLRQTPLLGLFRNFLKNVALLRSHFGSSPLCLTRCRSSQNATYTLKISPTNLTFCKISSRFLLGSS